VVKLAVVDCRREAIFSLMKTVTGFEGVNVLRLEERVTRAQIERINVLREGI